MHIQFGRNMLNKYITLCIALTAKQNIGHLNLLVDALINFVVTQFMELFIMEMGGGI